MILSTKINLSNLITYILLRFMTLVAKLIKVLYKMSKFGLESTIRRTLPSVAMISTTSSSHIKVSCNAPLVISKTYTNCLNLVIFSLPCEKYQLVMDEKIHPLEEDFKERKKENKTV